jgi:hypothetical protein
MVHLAGKVTRSSDKYLCSFARHVRVRVVLGVHQLFCFIHGYIYPLERPSAIISSLMLLAMSQQRTMSTVSSLGVNARTMSSERQCFP